MSDDSARPHVAATPEASAANTTASADEPANAPAAESTESPAGPSSQPAERPIRLSAGVAIPQPLPTGTAMAFSVDYAFVDGSPNLSSKYLWVVRAAAAEGPWETPVQLSGRDTLQTFVAEWRPRHGPFETFIAEIRPDGSRRTVSPVEPLKENDW